ncbi:MAG: ABC transporter permease subunit [Nitriliruptoraceae bacterium]
MKPRFSATRRVGNGTIVILVLAWSLHETGVGITSLIDGRAGALRMLKGVASPDMSGEFLGIVGSAIVETLHISLAALVFAVVLGVPLALLIAGNVGAPAFIRQGAVVAAATLRGVPELLLALVFVATVGLGPAAGVYAIGLHGAGLLAKLLSEQLEAVPRGPVTAIRAMGAPRYVIAGFGIIPQASSDIVSLILYQWECNIRTATIVGFVGGGGVGQLLDIALKLFRYDELATLVLAVLAIILAVDMFSRALRQRVGATVSSVQ